MTNTNQLPPHNHEAERSVIGSCLRDNAIVADVAATLAPDHFYADAHQKIFAAVLALWEDAKPIDTVTLAECLKQRKQIEDVGGYAYLYELLNAAPTAGNFSYYADIVRDNALVRGLVHIGCAITQDAYAHTGSATEQLEAAEEKIFALAKTGVGDTTVTADRMITEMYVRVDARTRNDPSCKGIPTGLRELDDRTGGLHRGELILPAARPSNCKTALSLHFTINALRKGIPVFFISLEQRYVELAERIACCLADVDSQKVRNGLISSQDVDKLLEAGEQFRKFPIFVDDYPKQSIVRIISTVRRHVLRKGVGLAVIDYVQLIEGDRRTTEYENLTRISRSLKILACETKIPLVVAAQLNRGAEERGRPRLSHLKGSGSLEQDADVVLLLHWPDTNSPEFEIDVAKQRNGQRGLVTVAYRKHCYRFENAKLTTPYGVLG